MTDVGPALRRLRDKKGFTQKDVGESMEIHESNVSRMEKPGAKPLFKNVALYLESIGCDLIELSLELDRENDPDAMIAIDLGELSVQDQWSLMLKEAQEMERRIADLEDELSAKNAKLEEYRNASGLGAVDALQKEVKAMSRKLDITLREVHLRAQAMIRKKKAQAAAVNETVVEYSDDSD